MFFKKTLWGFQGSLFRFPGSLLDYVIYRPDAQLSKASSVQTTRTFHPDLPLCQKALNYSSLHPSGRFSSTSRRHSVFDQLWDFFPKTQIWEDRCNSPNDVNPSPNELIHKASCAFKILDVQKTALMVRTRELLIWKWRASDQPSEQPFPCFGHAKPWYGNYVQLKCDHSDDRATPSGRGSKQERISAKFWETDRTVVLPDSA